MFFYSMVNFIILATATTRKADYILLCANMGCVIFANLYLFYSLKVEDEKNSMEFQIAMMKQQESMQFEHYVRQREKYENCTDYSSGIQAVAGIGIHQRMTCCSSRMAAPNSQLISFSCFSRPAFWYIIWIASLSCVGFVCGYSYYTRIRCYFDVK